LTSQGLKVMMMMNGKITVGSDSTRLAVLVSKPIFVITVDSLVTHAPQWTLQAMGFEGVWGSRKVLKINPLKF
jgi:hypothetical protein